MIEHVPTKEPFLAHLRKFMKLKGMLFVGFPAWQMPFGGLVHQPTLQTEVPPYPTTLATLGLEDEVYQKFLHHFMLVYIDHKP